MSTAIDEAVGDPGWPELTKFLEHAGLAAGPLQRTITLLAEFEVSNLSALKAAFAKLPLKAGTRKLIENALKAAAAAASQPAASAPAPAQPVVHTFHVLVSFKEQTVTLLLALPDEDYSGKPLRYRSTSPGPQWLDPHLFSLGL